MYKKRQETAKKDYLKALAAYRAGTLQVIIITHRLVKYSLNISQTWPRLLRTWLLQMQFSLRKIPHEKFSQFSTFRHAVHSPGKLSIRKLIYYQKFSASQREKLLRAEACSASAPSLHSLSSVSPLPHSHMTLHPPPAENFNFLIYLIFISFDSAHFHHIWDISPRLRLEIFLLALFWRTVWRACNRCSWCYDDFCTRNFQFQILN